MFFLGFDYGTKRIGIAVGQRLTGTATPLIALKTRKKKPDWDAISTVINTWKPAALVVGLPLLADGSDSQSTLNARHFMHQLQQRFGLPVHGMDETLSSYAAQEFSPDPDDPLDAIAAQLILESWFSSTPAIST
ncbi:MAG: Holliday junction resolvase RuvX [Pseudomonadota bacterium]|jgi:putative Holliday junction resolvase